MKELGREEIQMTIPEYTGEEFIEFTRGYSKTYIYGPGLIGKKLYYTIGNKLHNVVGFLISDGREITENEIMGRPVIHYSERDKDSCIIMALDKEHSGEVFDVIGNDGKMMYLRREYN
jgi:hypothetical protein